MDVKRVRILGGIAHTELEVHGKRSPYTGAWYMVVESANDTHYGLECLVPGKPDTLAGVAGVLGDWSKNQYLLRMERDTEEGKVLPVTAEEAKELRAVLQDVKEGKLTPTDVYGTEIPKNYSDQVMGFLEPRVEIAAKHYVEGRTFAPYREIERELQPPPEIPPVPRA